MTTTIGASAAIPPRTDGGAGPVIVVHGAAAGHLAQRTVRVLRAASLPAIDLTREPPASVAALFAGSGGCWLVRAGSWPVASVSFPAPSDTGQPLCALGAMRSEDAQPEALEWTALLARTGGVLRDLPSRLASIFLDRALAQAFAAALACADIESELLRFLSMTDCRRVRFAPLDVHFDPGLRVAQVVTSLQQGGAERVAIDLVRELPAQGVRARLFVLGAPTRPAYAAPSGTIDCSRASPHRRERVAAVARAAIDYDIVHGHLLEYDDLAPLRSLDVPLVLTLHNTRQGWPLGTERLTAGDATLLVACARAVENELGAAGLGMPTRTVWNGVDFARFAVAAERPPSASRLRAQLGIGAEDVVLLSLANARPQKRLERLPGVLRAVQARLLPLRRVWLVLAGSAANSPSSLQAAAAFRAAVDACGVAAQVRELGSVADVETLLGACDVLICASAHEGLSLAHIEALAASRPLVATAAGGTCELAAGNPAAIVVPLEATPEMFAEGVAEALAAPAGRTHAVRDFSSARMAEGYARLYPAALAVRQRRQRRGLLLVSNNFSTGGAQSSARRLLLELARRGERVRAAVVQEQPDHPTPGRSALERAGIPVLALPAAGTGDPAVAVARLLRCCEGDAPEAILLWNVIPEYKMLIADALLDLPLFDVSPGEMYFTSLERYFAKPRPGLPYRSAREYGTRLAGAIVKYAAETERASALLRAPVSVIANGVPLPTLASRKPQPVLVLGALARLAPHKRIEDLLAALGHALPRLPRCTLRIAGGMEPGAEGYPGHLRALATGLPVEWVGELEEPQAFLASIDLFLQISEPAGCPNASLEAMAAALPVIATNVGGMSEQIEDGVNGRLVPPRDTKALAEAIVEAAKDAIATAEWGRAGRRIVEERYSIERMATDYARVVLART